MPAERDRLLLRLMGSPDPMQLDGLGGTHSSTSKVMAVGPAAAGSGADVDYLFAQVAVDEAVVDLTGNCGNLTAAVGHYAIDEGMVAVSPGPGAGPAVVRLRNLNTGVVIRATIPVTPDGRAAWEGDTVIDGVPGTGAPIVTDYLDPGGSVTGKLFPTGARTEDLGGHRVSIVDVSSPYVFLAASAFGLTGHEAPADLNGRRRAAGRAGDPAGRGRAPDRGELQGHPPPGAGGRGPGSAGAGHVDGAGPPRRAHDRGPVHRSRRPPPRHHRPRGDYQPCELWRQRAESSV